jgi:UDP-glucose 4-epimerase
VNKAHVLFGGGGILGSGYRAALARAGANVIRLTPRWGEPGDSAAVLESALPPLISRNSSVVVIWAAGVGHTGAGDAAMRAESTDVQSLCDVITRLPAAKRMRVSMLFASSAGALYGGHGYSEISETDPPCPVTAYGREKQSQEEGLHAFAAETGCRVVICRYSNLYGLACGRLTARGLVSTAVRATRLRHPMVVYVGPDTRRDVVYNADAAAESLKLVQGATAGVTTAFIRDGETRTVSEILALVGRVSGRRVPATYAERPETRLQPKVLRFRRPTRDSDRVRRTPMEVAVHLMLRAPMTP